MSDDMIDRAAKVIADALNGPADVSLHGSYTEVDYLPDATLDGRYNLVVVARALAEAGLLAPAPLREIQAETQFGDTYRRSATDWELVDRAEGNGKGITIHTD